MSEQKYRKYKRVRNKLGRPEEVKQVLDYCLQKLGKPENALLTRLWQHWDMVMGEDIAPLAFPLGHKGGVLFVGGEDAMSVQELSFLSLEIQERANAFMEKDFFKEVKVRLSLDKAPLHEVVKRTPFMPPLTVIKGPKLSGKYLDEMDSDSPVARCYARYVNASKKDV